MEDTGSTEEESMDYLVEAKKFIQRSRDASTPEVIGQNLSMAEWCLAQAIAERDGAPPQDPRHKDPWKKPH
jgi:hypothetical protein